MQQLTLREARKRRRLSQEQLAAKSGVKQTNISAIERGAVRDPNSSTLLALAAALEMDPRALKFGEPQKAIA